MAHPSFTVAQARRGFQPANRSALLLTLLGLAAAVGIGVMVLSWRLRVVASVWAILFGAGLALVRPDLGLVLLIMADAAELSRVASSQSAFTAVRVFGGALLLAWLAQGQVGRSLRRLASPQLLALVGYFTVAGAGVVYADRPDLSLPILREYLMIFVLFALVVLFTRREQEVRQVSWTLVLAALASVAIAIRQYEPHMERLASSQSNPNYFALHLVTVLPLALYLGIGERRAIWRLAALPAALLLVWAIMKTFSRGAFLGLAVVGVVMVIHLLRYPRRASRNLLAPAFAVMLLSLLLLPAGYVDRIKTITQPGADESVRSRRETNVAMFQIFLDHPLLGVGIGNSVPLSVVYNPSIYFPRVSHNIVLEVAAETGLVGLLFFAFALGYAALDFRRAAHHFAGRENWLMYAVACGFLLGLVGFLVTALFKTATVVRVLWLCVAMSVVMRNLVAAGEEPAAGGA